MDDPNESEYLGWFVILDREARKGCLEIDFNGVNLGNYSLTVDYQEDLDRCHNLLKKIGKDSISEIRLEDILKHLEVLDSVSDDMVIKLPKGVTMNYKEFVQMQWDQGFIVKEKHSIKI
jgi:spore coat polysaccharide biosynthesis protein SpsF (cytidylyltransferase family)